MSHDIYRIIAFEIIKPYTLRVKFDDREERVINFLPMLTGDIYGPLRDENLFNQVEIDPETRTLVWPNGADFDPETLHEWLNYSEEMRKMAENWNLEKVRSS